MGGNYPFHHPRYAGQMLKPPHPVAIAAYTAAMHVNAEQPRARRRAGDERDGGGGRARPGARCSASPADALGHLTVSGTIANLEALWVARELHPGKAVVYGDDAHYTHSRMCRCSACGDRSARDLAGRIDLDAVDALRRGRRRHRRASPPARPGSGASTRSTRRSQLRERYGVRIHVDAAYGGFFTLLDDAPVPAAPFRAIADADWSSSTRTSTACSPTGAARCCSATRASAASTSTTRRTRTSPRGELHLGEISLECSRAGAAAAALWLTLRALDLAPILAAGVRAARAWAALIEDSDVLRLYLEPELDILTLLPVRRRASEIDAASARVLDAGMVTEDPVFLSTLMVDGMRILRSVLMKPEHEPHVPWLHERVSALASDALR